MAEYPEQLQNMANSMGLDVSQVPRVKFLTSFHDIGREIRKRLDTNQYIYIESEDSYRDGVDCYFNWSYIEPKNYRSYGLLG